jgi:predicted enzyme related to lactoylglutathione lyase
MLQLWSPQRKTQKESLTLNDRKCGKMDCTIVHFEIPAKDVEKMRKFYSGLFGWKIEKAPGPIPYWTIETVPIDKNMTPLKPGVNGGMYEKDSMEQRPVNYISVDSIDEYIKKIQASGGKIVQEKQEVQGVGWIAVALDPEGNQFAMLQPILQ